MLKKYANFSQFFYAFQTGKIMVQSADGRVGLYKNFPDPDYWQAILQAIWDKLNKENNQ